MEPIAAALLVVTSLLAARSGIGRLWRPTTTLSQRALWASATAMFGVAIASAATTLRAALLPAGNAADITWNVGCSAFLSIAAWKLPLLPRSATDRVSGTGAKGSRALSALAIAFALTAAVCCAVFVEHTLRMPDGGWDAWAIWNFRARALFLGGGTVSAGRDGYEAWLLTGFHWDYPLLIPSLVFRLWTLVGSDTAAVPALVGVAFGTAVIVIVASVVAIEAGAPLGLIAGIVIAATPAIVEVSCWQICDVPLSAFVTLALAFVVLATGRAGRDRMRLFALAGAASGCAALTKNEGALHALAIVAAIVIAGSWRSRVRERLFEVSAWATGAAPLLAVLFIYRLSNAIPSQQVSSTVDVLVTRAAATARYGIVLRYLSKEALDVTNWGPLLIVLALAFPFAVVAAGKTARVCLIAVSLCLAGFIGAYVMSPYDLDWQLSTSLSRLLVQIVPAALIGCMLAFSRSPDRAEAIVSAELTSRTDQPVVAAASARLAKGRATP